MRETDFCYKEFWVSLCRVLHYLELGLLTSGNKREGTWLTSFQSSFKLYTAKSLISQEKNRILKLKSVDIFLFDLEIFSFDQEIIFEQKMKI